MKVGPATPRDVAAIVHCLADAFAGDELMRYCFRTHVAGIREGTIEFFSVLLRARLALGMPAIVLGDPAAPQGAAMGYDTTPPDWPAPQIGDWAALESRTPGVAERFDAYERIADAFRPAEPHHYLGVIGVHPGAQGRGAGKVLLDAFCGLAAADPRSGGVYLETASPASRAFYLRNGFVSCGEGSLDTFTLWCLFRPTP